MAERRMFAKTIVLSDAFLDMPATARCLYFTFGMLADDDGFVNNPKSIMRQCGASDDDLKILLAKKFLLAFESGVIVIKHWRINNYLRSDRYVETKYTDEKQLLQVDENGGYKSLDTIGIPLGIPNGNQMDTQDRLGKDSKGYINTLAQNEPQKESKSDPIEERFEVFWKAYPKKTGKGAALKSFKKIKPSEDLLNKMLSSIEQTKQTDQWKRDNGQYIPYPATWLNQGRWEDEVTVQQDSWSKNY